jgi:hypothetical protein
MLIDILEGTRIGKPEFAIWGIYIYIYIYIPYIWQLQMSLAGGHGLPVHPLKASISSSRLHPLKASISFSGPRSVSPQPALETCFGVYQ